MTTRTAELVLKLTDKVSSPASAITGRLNGLSRLLGGFAERSPLRRIDGLATSFERLEMATRGMTRLMGIGGLAGSYAFTRAMVSFQEARNVAFGRLLDEEGEMPFGDGSKLKRPEAEAWFDALVARTDAALPLSADQIAQAVSEGAGAGLTPAQIEGILKPAMEFATAARIDPASAMLDITSVAKMFQLPLGNVEEANDTIVALADKMTYGANQSAQSAEELYEAIKYAGPLASVVGMTVDDLIGQTMVLANRGQRGSEAGVALRQQLSSLIKPTKQGAATLESYGINLSDYTTGELSPEGVVAQLQAAGMDAAGLAGPIGKILEDSNLALTEKVSAIAKMVTDQTKGSAADLEAASNAIFEGFASSGKLDVMGVIAALDDANVKAADWIRIFTLRGGAKTLGLLDDDARKTSDDVAQNAAGTASRVAAEQMRDLPGAIDRISSSFGRLAQAVGDSALVDGIISALDTATSVVSWVATLPDPILSIAAGAAALAGIGGTAAVVEALTGVGGILGAAAGLAAAAIRLLGPIGVAAAAIQVASWGVTALNDWRMQGVRKTEETESSPQYLQQQLDEIDASIEELRANPGAQLPMMVDGATEMLTSDQAIDRMLVQRAAVADQLSGAIANSVSAAAPKATADMTALLDRLRAIGSAGIVIPAIIGARAAALPATSIDGARAAGGPVSRGGTFLVGEGGPELFVPKRAGTIHSAADTGHLLSGKRMVATNVTNHFHIHATDPDAIASRIGNRLDKSLQRSRGLSMDGRREFE